MNRPKRTQTGEITAESFELLLNAISSNGGDPSVEYERLRKKLARYFQAHSVGFPEDCVDVVFDRVALKLGTGEQLDLSTDSYFLTVARFVMLEHVRGPQKRTLSIEDGPELEPVIDHVQEAEELSKRIRRELGLDAIAECTGRLSPDETEILLTYDGGSGREKIDRRNALAERLGKSKATLIVAVSRIRSKIKDCVKAKLALNPAFATM